MHYPQVIFHIISKRYGTVNRLTHNSQSINLYIILIFSLKEKIEIVNISEKKQSHQIIKVAAKSAYYKLYVYKKVLYLL